VSEASNTVSEANTLHERREKRGRNIFWIDDRVIDEYGPLLRRYSFGAHALAVYAVLARRASRDGESWERVKLMARQAATTERMFQRCIRLLELLGLIAVDSCYYEGTRIQASNRYTLLTPPQAPPEVDPDPARWPAPVRRVILVTRGPNRRHISDARPESSQEVVESRCEHVPPDSTTSTSGNAPLDSAALPAPLPALPTGCRPDTTPGAVPTPTPRREDTTPGVPSTPYEGNTGEGNTWKEESFDEKDGCKTTVGRLQADGQDDELLAAWPTPCSSLADFVIQEIGLTNRQVWAATLGELARRGEVGRTELESWLRPAALIGRDGTTLVIGAPNAVSRERIATRLVPAVRQALSATIGSPVEVSVVVASATAGTG
jgi:hypothetical protein